jgi:hypothetical protein
MTTNEVDQECVLPLGLSGNSTARRIQQVHPAMEGEGDEGSKASVLVHIQVEAGCEVGGGILNGNEAAVHPPRVRYLAAAPE